MEENNLNEAERLKLVVADLNRRLKNAQLTIEAERTIAKNATAQADLYRQKLGGLSNMLRLETARAFNIETKHMQQMEAKRFESNKERATNLHQQLRLEEVDHWMTANKREPLKLQKLRTKVANLESEQESQKKLLQEMTEIDSLNEKLSTAAQLGNLGECNHLLRSGAWVNYVDAAGYLPIHYACANGYYDVVKLCLEFGADHSSFLTGHSPVVVAASNGRIDIIDLLLGFGANIEDKGSGRCPATIAAMMSNNFEAFAYLVNEAGADLNSCDGNENTALHLAARLPDREQSIQTILFLLDKGVDTQRINRKGHTALQVALYDENKPAAHALGGEFVAEVVDELGATEAVNQRTGDSKRNNTAGPVQMSACMPNLNNNGQSGKTRSNNVQYLPKSIDSPQRASISQLRASSSSAKVSNRGEPTVPGVDGEGAATEPATGTAPAPGTADTSPSGTAQARRQAALGTLSTQLRGKPVARAGGEPVARQIGSQPQTKDNEGGQPNSAACKQQPGRETVKLKASQSGEADRGNADAREESLADTSLSGESGLPHMLNEAQAGGMFDSQSVISAVTFGTANIERP